MGATEQMQGESERSKKETAVDGARVWSGERSEWIGKQINRPCSWIILKWKEKEESKLWLKESDEKWHLYKDKEEAGQRRRIQSFVLSENTSCTSLWRCQVWG